MAAVCFPHFLWLVMAWATRGYWSIVLPVQFRWPQTPERLVEYWRPRVTHTMNLKAGNPYGMRQLTEISIARLNESRGICRYPPNPCEFSSR
jgi:hypothetical protein